MNIECQAVCFLWQRTLQGKKGNNLMVRIHWKECRYSGTWVGKRRLKIWVTLLISVCFLSSNQFENKEEKKTHSAALLSLVSQQGEALTCGLKSKLILCHAEVYFYFFYGSSDASFVGSVAGRLKRNTSSSYSWDCAISYYDWHGQLIPFFSITWWHAIKSFGRKYKLERT